MWSRLIATICGFLDEITPRSWKDAFGTFRATLFGSTGMFTDFYIYMADRHPSLQRLSWLLPYGTTTTDTAPAREEIAMDQNVSRCGHCSRTYSLRPDNCIFYAFLKRPWMCYWICTCDHCGCTTRAFVRDNWKPEWAWAERAQVPMITEEFPSDEQTVAFEEVYDVHIIREHTLSDGEEREVAFFAYLIKHNDWEIYEWSNDDQ